MKLCECGCGQPTQIAAATVPSRGWVKGKPRQFLRGHWTRTEAGREFQSKLHSGKEIPAWHRERVSLGRTGLKDSPETRMKKSAASKGRNAGAKHYAWKGENASYKAIHAWVNAWKVKSGKCSTCSHYGYTEWANISGVYLRDLSDYAEMCIACHEEFDWSYQEYFQVQRFRGRPPRRQSAYV